MATTVANDDANKLTVVVLGPGTASAATTAVSCATTKPPPPSSARHVQWLRAAVLGASDCLVSTAAIMLGVGAARPGDGDADDLHGVLLAGLAGLVAGACSMAIGEYVSVHAQLDVELAELKRAAEDEESATAGDDRDGGAPPDRAAAAADLSSPGQVAAASAVSFAAGAAVALLVAWFVTGYKARVAVVVATATATLAVFGWLGAVLGRALGGRTGLRAVVGGLVAMGITGVWAHEAVRGPRSLMGREISVDPCWGRTAETSHY